jgi:FixJ family two-component response regulator
MTAHRPVHRFGGRSSQRSAQTAIALRTRTNPSALRIIDEAGLRVKQLATVFIIDDDTAVLTSIESLLTAQSYEVKCCASVNEFIAQNHSTQLGCVVIDLSKRSLDGSELIRHLHEIRSVLSVVIISGLIDSAIAYRKEKGKVPILAKPYEIWILLTMIEDAIAGSLKRNRAWTHVMSSQIDEPYLHGTNVPAKEKISKLTPRQRDVISLLLAGDSLKEIAQKLGLSKHTVGDYVKEIYKHFSVSSRAELLAQFIPGGQP